MSSVNQDMSLFIPRVFLNITAERIKNCVENFGLGEVERVDLVLKGNFNAAYIHFNRWNNTSFVSRFQDRAADPQQQCTITYDGPWYWIVLENTSAKRVGPERRKEVINIRPEFMEPMPCNEDECESDCALDVAHSGEKTVPYTVFEDVMWDMELMQTQIDDQEDRIRGQEEEISNLKKLLEEAGILDSQPFSCAVTGAKYTRMLVKPAVYKSILVQESGIQRETAEGE
jgi:hypothetical protein